MNKIPPIIQYRRSPWTAAILSLIMPGLGQVYVGALAQGLVWMFLCGTFLVMGLLILSFPAAHSWTLGCVAELSSLVIWLAAAVDSRRLALRCKPDYELKDYNRWYVYVLLLLIGTGSLLAYALYVRGQMLQAFIVPGAAMYPTILPNDRVIAIKNAYQTVDPLRGDIVLFADPDDRRIFFIKRVIAISGDTVEIKSGKLYINHVELPLESIGPATISSGKTTSTGEDFYENNNGAKYRIFISREKQTPDFGPSTVPKHDCFVMGDNRNNALDSRYFGPIALASLRGKFEYRFWPITGGAHWGTIR
ncbi:MAG TPA: signal peptidase I [Candidatus Sulfotelmatobacter sp.]|nr:signal peptidase I [Candidatus Sulfotelmatobacter sp.]